MEIKYQVFVSSTYEDLKDERKEITQAILESHCIPAGMELFPASNIAQWEMIKRVIDDSDFYLLIVAGKYGSIGKNDSGKEVSYTEMEFDYAIESGKPVLALIYEDIDLLPKYKVETTKKKIRLLNEFRKKVYTGRIIKKWSNKDNLKSAALTALSELKNNTDAPEWIRADYIIEQQMYNILEQQRLQFESGVKDLKSALNLSSTRVQEVVHENENLSQRINALNGHLEQLTRENLRLSQLLAKKIDFWECLLQINLAYGYITDSSERLIDDMRNERPLSNPEQWFLKHHGSRRLWKSIMDQTESLLQAYEHSSDEQKRAYLNNLDVIISKYSSDHYDSYIMPDEDVTELVSNLFFFLKLCERYKFSDQFELLNAKATECTSLCNSLIEDSWEMELALCDNDY